MSGRSLARTLRLVDLLQSRYPDVILHLRDHLVAAPQAGFDTDEIAYAKVPACTVRARLVVTAGSHPVGRGAPVSEGLERCVHVAAFVSGSGRQMRTPRREAEAWARAIVGDLLGQAVHRCFDGQRWPWPDQLRLPAEKFVVLQHPRDDRVSVPGRYPRIRR